MTRIHIKESPGQALVELAFVSIALVFMLFGAIDLGRAFGATVQMENMARAGAQYGTFAVDLGITDIPAGMEAAALAEQATIFGVEPVVTAELQTDANGYCSVYVQVVYNFEPIIGIAGLGPTIELSRDAEMRMLFPPSGSTCK